MNQQEMKYGIAGHQAPEFSKDIQWVDGKGLVLESVQLQQYKGQFKVIYGFQAWCPGCHSRGLPALRKLVEGLKDNPKVVFFAIQTVFEGAHVNTKKRVLEIQKEYKLEIPFGHDLGDETTGSQSSIMFDYKTGGTPWFILIDQKNRVVFDDFHLNVDKVIEYLKLIK